MRIPFTSFIAPALGLGLLFGAPRLDAQPITFTTLHRFSTGDGILPLYGLTQGPDGTLYGTCNGVNTIGGAGGSVFKLNPDTMVFTVLHTFNPTDSMSAYNTGGANPLDGPILGTDGLLYGCTYEGGTGAYGVVYSLTTNGDNYNVLTQFTATETGVEYQSCGIVQGSDGFLYGAGDSDGISNWETQVYKIDTNGNNYANLAFFTYTNGGNDYNPLLPGRNGNLYGVTGGDAFDGNPANVGTVFMVTPGGSYTDLHDLAGSDGQSPGGGLIEDDSGTLYGTAAQGGTYSQGTAFRADTNGLSFIVIHQFGNGTDGAIPYGRLLLASDGNIYGTTMEGGAHGYGTIFRMSTNGDNYQVLYNFTGNVGPSGDHGYPNGCLIQAPSGLIYGMTGDTDYNFDPPIGNGTIFEIDLAPPGTSVLSINRASASPTNLTSVSWTVTFAGAVTGLDATNFELAGSGLGGSPAITSVSGSGTTWTVTANTGSGMGTLQLNLTNAAGISPAVTNSLPFNGQTYIIDQVAPTITLGSPFPAITASGAVSFSVTYADADFNASTLTAADITLNTAGTANATVISVNGAGTAWTVTLSGITGDGTLGISIAADTASDTAGNVAGAAGPSATATVDNTPPTVTISGATPVATANGPTSSVSYTVTYADAHFNAATLTAGNITLTNPAVTASVSVTENTATSYTVTLSQLTGAGLQAIQIAAGTATDLAGNTAPAAGPSYPVVVDLWQYDSLYSFTNGDDGNMPQGGLALAADGKFYGTTLESGINNNGTIFSVDTNGVCTVLYSFTGLDDGGTPQTGLALASDGFLYGTTVVGGTNNSGEIFRVSTNGDFQVIYAFSSSGLTDGYFPEAPLVQGTDGYLYGTTAQGGENFIGNIFRVSTNGVVNNLFSFTGGPDGYTPMAPLFQASDGNFYGTASMGGTNNQGTIFQITPAGVLTPLYSFSAAPNLTNDDGAQPLGGLVQGRDGGLYGVTSSGGPFNGGTVFRITTNGAFSVVHALDLYLEGADSAASLILGSDGDLYGTTQYLGPAGNGSVFRVTTNGVLTVLYSFVGGSFGDGSGVTAPVLQGPKGNLFGAATGSGGGYFLGGSGAIFELINPNPTPLIITQPTNLTVSVGSNASFTVSAASASPLTYQWTFDGTNIDAATNTALILTNLTLAQAGSYAVNVANSNGVVPSVAALLSVTQAEAVVTLSNLAQTYDGTAKIVTATTQPLGLTVNLLYNNLPEAPTNAGSYTVIGTVDDPSYIGSATNTLMVSNATLVATANSSARYANQPNPTFTGSLVGAVASDDLSLSFTTTATPGSAPGGYDIVPVVQDPNNRLGNYNVTLVDGTLTVILRQATIILSTNRIYYTLDQDPVVLDPAALFSSPGSPSFVGGQLTVEIASNPGPNDLLSFQNLAPGIVSYIGGTEGDTNLQITFNSLAVAADIQQLLRNLTFAIDAHEASNLTRTLQIAFNDSSGLTSAPVALNIVINHRPQAAPFHIDTGTNLPLAITYARLLTNSTDVDGDVISIVTVDTNSFAGGVVTTSQTGLIYTPPMNFAGEDHFSYFITDGRTGTNTGIVNVTILTGATLVIEGPLLNPALSGQNAVLEVSGIPGFVYHLQASDDLILWIPIGVITIPDAGSTNFVDSGATNHPHRFYRTSYP